MKSYCFFATHFHELTQLSNHYPTIGNLHVTAVNLDNHLTFLYTVEEGSCDQSFGIHVTKMVHFPQHIIEVSDNVVVLNATILTCFVIIFKVCRKKSHGDGRFKQNEKF